MSLIEVLYQRSLTKVATDSDLGLNYPLHKNGETVQVFKQKYKCFDCVAENFRSWYFVKCERSWEKPSRTLKKVLSDNIKTSNSLVTLIKSTNNKSPAFRTQVLSHLEYSSF